MSHLVGSIAGAAIGSIGVVGLLLYLQGSQAARRLITGTAASDRFPRWLGWAYTVATAGFVLSFILWPVGMSVFSGLFIIATAVLAWSAARQGQRQHASVAIAPEI